MEIKKIKRKIVSKLDKQNNQYEINSNEMISKLKDIDALLDEAASLGASSTCHQKDSTSAAPSLPTSSCVASEQSGLHHRKFRTQLEGLRFFNDDHRT